MSHRIIIADVLDGLRGLDDESVQCIVTSPPYWNLRNYGTATWEGGDADCDHVTGRVARTFTDASNKQLTNKGAQANETRGVCPKCGAVSVDRQIGLEPTISEYVEKMRVVFRECKRVLRNDGTLWLNLGDSYIGYKGDNYCTNPSASNLQKKSKVPASHTNGTPQTSGLKSKDLCGIPWRVAFALQEPYYTGTIKNEADRIWLAAMLDAEGCMFIHKRKVGQSNGQGYVRKNDSYGPGIEIANTSEAIVNRCMEIVGRGSICSQSPDQNARRKQTIYRWNLRLVECKDLVRELYPYLIGKQRQARILYGCPSSGEVAAAAHAALLDLHRGNPTDVDAPEPPTMFEPGWYLRKDVIWKKANPMPESVRDRPTSAHEYIFLLTKNAKYFYDADAIREPVNDGSVARAEKGYNCAFASQFKGSPTDKRHQNGKVIAPTKKDKQRGHGRRHDGFNDRWDAMPKEEQCANGANARSVWTISTEPYSGSHYAVFPSELPRRCILAGSKAGDTILDPFAGSGTTIQVAIELGRNVIGIDLDERNRALIETRILGTTPPLEGLA